MRSPAARAKAAKLRYISNFPPHSRCTVRTARPTGPRAAMIMICLISGCVSTKRAVTGSESGDTLLHSVKSATTVHTVHLCIDFVVALIEFCATRRETRRPQMRMCNTPLPPSVGMSARCTAPLASLTVVRTGEKPVAIARMSANICVITVSVNTFGKRTVRGTTAVNV
eukprot:7319482-Prymnesium_polylepis.1